MQPGSRPKHIAKKRRWLAALASAVTLAFAGGGAAPAHPIGKPSEAHPTGKPAAGKEARPVDRSGRTQVGKASIYARKFANRKMANGRPMNPRGDNAASKTLPLGTRALVKNLETGRSAVVTIEDRGPYVRGRIVDLSPATAEQIGLPLRQGIATVEVTPLALPQPKGSEAQTTVGSG